MNLSVEQIGRGLKLFLGGYTGVIPFRRLPFRRQISPVSSPHMVDQKKLDCVNIL